MGVKRHMEFSHELDLSEHNSVVQARTLDGKALDGIDKISDSSRSLSSLEVSDEDKQAIANLQCDQIEEDSIHSDEDGVQKQKYFFTNWMEIVYLFDLRLIESNLYLQALQNPHGSDLAQQEDSYYILDKCLPLSNGEKKKIVPNPYFKFLSTLNKKNQEDNKTLQDHKEQINLQTEINWQCKYDDPIQAQQHKYSMQSIQQRDLVLQVTNLQTTSSFQMKFSSIHNKLNTLHQYFNQYDQQAGVAIEFGKLEDPVFIQKPIMTKIPEKLSNINNSQEASKAALNDLSFSLKQRAETSSEKAILDNFQQKIISKVKNFAPLQGTLADITEDSANEGGYIYSTSEAENATPPIRKKFTYNKAPLVKKMRRPVDLNTIYEGTDFTSEAPSPAPPINPVFEQKMFDSEILGNSKKKLLSMIKTEEKQQETDNISQLQDNEVSEVNDYQSEQIKMTLYNGRNDDCDSQSSASLEDDPKTVKNTAANSEQFSEFKIGNTNVKISTKSLIEEKRIFNQDLQERFKTIISSMQFLKNLSVFGKKEKSNSIHFVSQEKTNIFQKISILKYEQKTFRLGKNKPLTLNNILNKPSSPNLKEQLPSSVESKQYLTPDERRWAHSYSSLKHISHNFYTNKEILDLLQLPISRVQQAQIIENIYSNFWKNVTECKLLPLTIDFFPEKRDLGASPYRLNEARVIPRPQNPVSLVPNDMTYLDEFLCLRLTQNMQYFSSNAMCYFDKQKFLQKREQMKTGINHLYHTLDFSDQEMKYVFEAWVNLQDNIKDEMSAKFKYLLFNYYDNRFQIKNSQESRMFNFRSLLNMEEVIEDFSQVGESLVKVPLISFILIPNKNKFKSEQQIDELIQNFKKFQNSFVALVTKDNQSQINKLASKKIQIQNVKIIKPNQGDEEHQFSDNFESYDEFSQKNSDLKKFNYLNQILLNCQQKFILLNQLEKMSEPELKLSPKSPQYLRSTIFCENYGQVPQAYPQSKNKPSVQPISGGYLLECDQIYNPSFSPCFSIRIQWIFATSVQIQDSIKSLQRRAKESDFELVQISDIAQKQELNPFEISTLLRHANIITYDLTKLNAIISKAKRLEKDIRQLEPIIPMQTTQEEYEEKIGAMMKQGSSGRRIRLYSDQLLIDQQNEVVKKQNEMQMTDSANKVAKQINEKEFTSSVEEFKLDQNLEEKSSKEVTQLDNTTKQIFQTGHSEYSRSINKSQQSMGSTTLLKINLESFTYKDLVTIQKYLQDSLFIQDDQLPEFQICKKLKKLHEVQSRQTNQIIELIDLIRKIIVQKLFNLHFKQYIQNHLQFYILKKSSNLTTFVQKSGICLLTLNEQTNEIIWLENDIIANSITQPQATTQNLQYQDPSQIIQVDKDIYNIGNNQYQISSQMQNKVKTAIFVLDILIDIIVKI